MKPTPLRTSDHRVADCYFAPIRSERASWIRCTCDVRLEGPTPELLDLEWHAHRREFHAERTQTRPHVAPWK